MNRTQPAIVAQSAVRRLPRWALFLLCLAYVVPGFVGREPWKSADITAFGYMLELASGHADWLSPTLLGQLPEFDALLPYWLGAWAIQLKPAFVPADFAIRVPFALLLGLALTATWYGVYYLARSPRAQPVAFAFGGEAHPKDYARAMADGGMLALIACLGLAQLSHETTPSVAQLAFSTLSFFAIAAMPHVAGTRRIVASLCLVLGVAGLSLSGGPTVAVLLSVVAAGVAVLMYRAQADDRAAWQSLAVSAVAAAVVAMTLATGLDLWRWRLGQYPGPDWQSAGRLLIWFAWPAWPLALWTLWRWRLHLLSPHLALPIGFAAIFTATAILTPTGDRSLLVALPALAALAAFALPTLQRSMAALVDWFTLLFFSLCALVIWVVWVAMQTGIPAKPAANVARLAPGFEPDFSTGVLAIAVVATLAWAWVVHWRVGRHRAAIWKSLVLPASGAALCWLLLMTLWMPLLDYARSYTVTARQVATTVGSTDCLEIYGLSPADTAAQRFYSTNEIRHAGPAPQCAWLLVDVHALARLPQTVNMRQWRLQATLQRPTDAQDQLVLFARTTAP